MAQIGFLGLDGNFTVQGKGSSYHKRGSLCPKAARTQRGNLKASRNGLLHFCLAEAAFRTNEY
jgi:hypothetical protein